MKLTNLDMEQMVGTLQKHLDRTDIIGYAAARNVRKLRDELHEYMQAREGLLRDYGEEIKDEDGNPTGKVRVPIDSERYPEFLERFKEFATIEHEPDIFKIKFEEAIGKISGTELLEIEWMFED